MFEESHPLKKPNRAPNHEYPKPEGKSKESGGQRIYHLQILTRAHTLIGFKKCEVSQLEPQASRSGTTAVAPVYLRMLTEA